MLQPTINHSLEEIREGIARKIAWLEMVIAKNSRWAWPPPVLVLVRKSQMLAAQQPLDLAHVQDFTNRLRQHVATHRLKGFEPFIWHNEALEYLAATQP